MTNTQTVVSVIWFFLMGVGFGMIVGLSIHPTTTLPVPTGCDERYKHSIYRHPKAWLAPGQMSPTGMRPLGVRM